MGRIQCKACHTSAYYWFKLDDYRGYDLCMKHLRMMREDPDEVMRLIGEKARKGKEKKDG